MPHFLANEIKFLFVIDLDHGGIEWSGVVSFDLRLSGSLDGDISILFECFSNLDGGDGVLGQVVQIDNVLSVNVVSHWFCLFLLEMKKSSNRSRSYLLIINSNKVCH